jgi:hypothetical protein
LVEEQPQNSYLDLENFVPPHHLVKNHKNHIEILSKEVNDLTKIAREKLENLRALTA